MTGFDDPLDLGGNGNGSGRTLSDGSEEVRNLQQKIQLNLQTAQGLERELLQIRFDEENAIKRIQQNVQLGQQARAIELEQFTARQRQLETIAEYGDKEFATAQSLLRHSKLRVMHAVVI